jgi:HK97 family phage prohead protease
MNPAEKKYFEIKSVDFNQDTQELLVKGYASIFGVEDSPQPTYNPNTRSLVMASDIVESGAFKKTLQERKERLAFCLNHKLSDPIGKLLEVKERNYSCQMMHLER